MNKVTIKAYGKVNLGLDVIGRREDGYHLVKMVMQTVDLFDDVTLWREETQTEGYEISLSCSEPSVPEDERNLAYRAADVICRRFSLRAKIRIRIEKRIPVEAGMAGGSADAAAVIRGMDQLFSLQMDTELKDDIALSLGADVPFCLRRGTWLSEGIGEVLTPLADLPSCYMVIVKPDVSISTAWAYHALDNYMQEHRDEAAHPDIDRLVGALNSGRIDSVAQHMGNMLELVAVSEYPVIRRIEDQLTDCGALRAVMSGSGPTVFGIFTEEEKADLAVSSLGGEGNYGRFKIKF